jgi:beta-glucanase (GH16 family)
MRVRRRVVVYALAAAVGLAAAYLVVVAPLRSWVGDDATDPVGGTGSDATSRPPGTATATAATASGVPMPTAAPPGWRQVLADDFAGTELDERTWFRYDGQPSGDPGGWFDPSHVSVDAGKLVIGAWQEPERDDLYATGGVSHHDTFSQAYGRYEVRFRADQGTGIAYVLLLWPANNEYPPEVDFAEDNGRDRQTIYGVLHPADPAFPNEEYTVEADATEWHTAGLEWTPERLVFTLDGDEWATIEGPQVPDEPMDLAMQTQAWYCGHGWEACPDESTPERVDLEVDWVVVYARA